MFDDNLGLPHGTADAIRAGVRSESGCDLVTADALDAMLTFFDGGKADAMSAPCGSIPYARGEPGFASEAAVGLERVTAPWASSTGTARRASERP